MHSADTVGVWRIMFVIRLVLNYVIDALKPTSLALHSCIWSAHTISTPIQQPCKHLYDSIADQW